MDEAKAKLGQAQVGRRPTKQVHGTLPTTLTKTIPISSALPVTQNQQIIINSDGSATNAVPISGSISIPVSQGTKTLGANSFLYTPKKGQNIIIRSAPMGTPSVNDELPVATIVQVDEEMPSK